jgi:hypothetical protein
MIQSRDFILNAPEHLLDSMQCLNSDHVWELQEASLRGYTD